MKIIFIINHFYPELGAVRTEFEIARKLAENNDVLVITTFPRKYRLPKNLDYNYPRLRPIIIEYVDKLKILRIRSFKSKIDEIKQRMAELLTSLMALLVSSFPLAPFNDVILVAGDIELIVSQIGILLAKIWRRPIAVILHDIHPDVLVKSGILRNDTILRIFDILIRIFSKHVDKVIVHSHTNANILSKRYNMDSHKVKVVELWANIDEIKPVGEEEKKNLKLRYLKNAEKLVISFAGVMNPPQGLEVVIHAAHILKHRYNASDKLLFLLVGDGMEKPKLQKLAKELNVDDIVKFLPLQPRNKYIEILQLSDICLVTLRKDYLQPVVPSKLLEIMAAGCPAILSMPVHSDAVRIIRKYKCGLYAGAGDPEKLANTILRLINDPSLREILSRNARKAAEMYYNLGRAAKEYEEILLDLVSSSKQGNNKASVYKPVI